MRRIAAVALLLLASCSGSAATERDREAELLAALGEAVWTDVPEPIEFNYREGRASTGNELGTAALSDVRYSEDGGGGAAWVTFVVYPNRWSALGRFVEFREAQLSNPDLEDVTESPRRFCFFFVGTGDCFALDEEVIVHVFTRPELLGVPQPMHEELLEGALEHLDRVRRGTYVTVPAIPTTPPPEPWGG